MEETTAALTLLGLGPATFRIGSGLVQIAEGIQRTNELMDMFASGATAALIIVAMSFGLSSRN
jgi:hypothetical protein